MTPDTSRDSALPTLADLQHAAEISGMHLIHDGREIKVSPIIPPGWFRIDPTQFKEAA